MVASWPLREVLLSHLHQRRMFEIEAYRTRLLIWAARSQDPKPPEPPPEH